MAWGNLLKETKRPEREAEAGERKVRGGRNRSYATRRLLNPRKGAFSSADNPLWRNSRIRPGWAIQFRQTKSISMPKKRRTSPSTSLRKEKSPARRTQLPLEGAKKSHKTSKVWGVGNGSPWVLIREREKSPPRGAEKGQSAEQNDSARTQRGRKGELTVRGKGSARDCRRG